MNNTTGVARVGLTPYSRKDGTQYFPQGYVDAIEAIGAEVAPIYHQTPLSTLHPLVLSLDAMVFSGGGDIDPRHYGQARDARCGKPDAARDRLELALADLVLSRDIPVLGICRGMQLLNVALGGTLRQHVDGHAAAPDPAAGMWHDIALSAGSRVAAIAGAERASVNSFHHQAVDQPGSGLVVSARADDGVVEAVELHGERFVVGLQWHPEKSLRQDEISIRFFEALRAQMR